MGFVQSFLEHTKDYESPTSFWRFSAYVAIASVLRDNCYFSQGSGTLFPNIYVLLLAGSADHRKGRPVELCEKLLKEISNTKIISGRASMQAILMELSRSETDKSSGKLQNGGSAIFIAPELSAAIVADPQAVGILIDLYTYRESYDSLLKGTGKFHIERMVFSFFSASNEDLLKQVFDTSAVRGGLLGRTFVITPNEYRPSNPLVRFDQQKEDLLKSTYTEARDHLLKISNLHGKFTLEEKALDEYERWYIPFRDSYRGKADKSGIVARLHTGVFKIAMILAANDQSLIIYKHHIEEAILRGLELLPNYQSFTLSGKSTIAEAGQIILPKLLDAPNFTLERSIILRDHWMNIDAAILDSLIISLETGGIIQSLHQGGHVSYRLTKVGIGTLGGKI